MGPFYDIDASHADLLRGAEAPEALELPYPVLHPALRDSAAARLGWERARLDELLDPEGDVERWIAPDDADCRLRDGPTPADALWGVEALVHALRRAAGGSEEHASDLLLMRLPPPPNAQRFQPWRRLQYLVTTCGRRMEESAPSIVLRSYRIDLQEALDDLFRTPAIPVGTAWIAGPTRSVEIRLSKPGADEGWEERSAVLGDLIDADAVGLLWVSDALLCVRRGPRTSLVSALDGSLERELTVEPGLLPVGTDGRHVVFLDPEYPLQELHEPLCGILVYDLDRGGFAERFPDSLPLVVLAHGEPEEATVVDLRTGWFAPLEPQDRTHHQAYTRALDAFWIGDWIHQVIDTRTGNSLLTEKDRTVFAPPPRWFASDGTKVGKTGEPEEIDPEGPAALLRSPDGLILACQTVGPSGAPWYGLAFSPDALSFSPDGAELAVLLGDEVLVFAVAPSRDPLRRRISLS